MYYIQSSEAFYGFTDFCVYICIYGHIHYTVSQFIIPNNNNNYYYFLQEPFLSHPWPSSENQSWGGKGHEH